MFEALLFLAASLVLTALFTPKAQSASPAAFEEFDFPQSDEGTPQTVYFGECWSVSWMVLSYGDYRTTPITKKGGKK